MTRHPRMGAAQQLWLLYRNHQEISDLQNYTDRQLLLLENFVPKCLHSANLFHSRSPFHCAESASFIGSVSHAVETGLLIPSDKRANSDKPPHCPVTRLIRSWKRPAPNQV
jgi:hypothetical protein